MRNAGNGKLRRGEEKKKKSKKAKEVMMRHRVICRWRFARILFFCDRVVALLEEQKRKRILK